MRKIFLIITFISTATISIGQNAQKPSLQSLTKITDSLIQKQRVLENEFDVLLTNLHNSNTLNDSLNKELVYYRAKEDYYSTALNEQSTRFTLLISSILALFGLLSFGIYKLELNQVKKFTKRKVEALEADFVKQVDKINDMDKNLNLAMGNLNISIAIYFKNKNSYTNAINYYLTGAKYLTAWKMSSTKKEEKEEEKFDKVFLNLELVENLIDKISSENIEKDKFKDENDKINKILDDFMVAGNPLLTNLIAKIRVKSNEYGK